MESGSTQRRSQYSPVISPGHRQSFEGPPPPVPTRRGLMILNICVNVSLIYFLYFIADVPPAPPLRRNISSSSNGLY